MGFETKKSLLEYLGKNPNDNKLVDRLILRGEVEIRDGMYYLVDKEERIKELEERIIFLEKEQGKNAWLQGENLECSNNAMEGNNTWLGVNNSDLEARLKEAQNDLTFQIGEYERLEYKMKKALEKCYNLMVEKKLVIKEKNPLPSFINWAMDVDMSEMDEDVPF